MNAPQTGFERDLLPAGRLPLVPAPATGEALTGYLDRVAAANGQTRAQIYDRARLPPLMAASYQLTSSEARATATILGLSRTEVHGMTLAGYRAFATVDVAGAPGVLGQPLWGLWPDVAAQCPQCHANAPGVYPLRTISGIGFACVTHRLLCVDRCPRCGNAVRLASTRHGRISGHHVPRPGRCEHSVGPTTCGHPLTELPRIDLTDWPAALDAQRLIDDLCAIPSCAKTPASASIVVLTALARWLLHPTVFQYFRGAPTHLHDLAQSNWRWRGDRNLMLHLGRRSRTCVALVMSVVAPGYLTGDAARLAADIRAVIPDPVGRERWYWGLPRTDPVVDAAVRLVAPASSR